MVLAIDTCISPAEVISVTKWGGQLTPQRLQSRQTETNVDAGAEGSSAPELVEFARRSDRLARLITNSPDAQLSPQVEAALVQALTEGAFTFAEVEAHVAGHSVPPSMIASEDGFKVFDFYLRTIEPLDRPSEGTYVENAYGAGILRPFPTVWED